MAPCSVVQASDLKSHLLFERLIYLHSVLIKRGHHIEELRKVTKAENPRKEKSSNVQIWVVLCLVLLVIYTNLPYIDGMMKSAFGVKCVVPNNYLVWEATRPVADCRMCQDVEVVFLDNATRESFLPYAYSYRPMVVRKAAQDWPATDHFDYDFFKSVFESTSGAYESVDEECQFLNFKSDFQSLKEVFNMPQDRVNISSGARPWYVGWSNCHPEVLKTMRGYYQKPHFLPEDAEHSHVDFIFMGYQQGAFMHLDYISRLMWQAQLRGHKTWRLNPPPECEHVCKSHSFTVNPGDILLLDTRQWYHDTYIKDGEFSLTVSSEYG